MLAQSTLTIAGQTFRTGDAVTTLDGAGVILSLDPFADDEILVRFADGAARWYSFRVVEQEAPA